jgi:hypothetical protein
LKLTYKWHIRLTIRLEIKKLKRVSQCDTLFI